MDDRVVVHFSTHFTRALRQLPKNIQERTGERDRLFRRNPFEPSLRTHKLTGKLKDYAAYSINRDLRVLFKFINSREVLYSHNTHRLEFLPFERSEKFSA